MLSRRLCLCLWKWEVRSYSLLSDFRTLRLCWLQNICHLDCLLVLSVLWSILFHAWAQTILNHRRCGGRSCWLNRIGWSPINRYKDAFVTARKCLQVISLFSPRGIKGSWLWTIWGWSKISYQFSRESSTMGIQWCVLWCLLDLSPFNLVRFTNLWSPGFHLFLWISSLCLWQRFGSTRLICIFVPYKDQIQQHDLGIIPFAMDRKGPQERRLCAFRRSWNQASIRKIWRIPRGYFFKEQLSHHIVSSRCFGRLLEGRVRQIQIVCFCRRGICLVR